MNDAISINLGGFADFPLTEPIDWLANPYASSLWQHHLLSLRWLRPWLGQSPGRCGEVTLRVLRDFFAYHLDPNTPKSPFFDGTPADHTMAERLLFLADVYRCQDLSEDVGASIVRLLRSHFERLVTGGVYRPRTNHGLMVDKAMLVAAHAVPKADPDAQYTEIALERCVAQVDWLFTSTGVTREHSISYQEYNLNICIELLDVLRELGEARALATRLEALLRQAQELLAYAVDSNGRLLPLGDTFRDSNPRIVASLRKRELLDPQFAFALSRGVEGTPPACTLVVDAEGGFAFVRDAADPDRVVHLGMTGAWHSEVHKQRDDLSFVLSCGTQELIVDAGYSDRRAETDIGRLTRSEMAHNVVVCEQRPWRSRYADAALRNQTRLTAYSAGPQVIAVAGQHQRFEEAVVFRILALVRGGILLVLDEIEAGLPGEFLQLLHLAPGLLPSARDGTYEVSNQQGERCARFTPILPVETSVVTTTLPNGPVCERWRDRSETEPTTCLVSSSRGDGSAPVKFAQLVEFGQSVALEPQDRPRLDALEWSRQGLSFRLTRSGQAEWLRAELGPLSKSQVRWP